MSDFKITDKNGIKLKTANTYVTEDLGVTLTDNDINNIVPENIAKNITILGVVGTFEGNQQTKTVEFNPGNANNITITPDAGYVLSSVQVNKPTTMIPNNIKSGVDIGGVVGTFEGNPKPEQSKMLDFNPGSAKSIKITPDEGYVLSDVIVGKPKTMIPGNIKRGVDIGGVIGTFEGGGNSVQKNCSNKNLNAHTMLGTTTNERKACDATFSKSIRVNGYDYYYFATITANKMYYNGVEIPIKELIQIGNANLYYGNSGSSIDMASIYMYRDGNKLYLTFHQDKKVIKVSGTPRTLVPIATITFSNDATVASQRPSLGTETSYTQVYGQSTGSVSNYPVVVPSDATKILNLIQFYYDGSLTPNVSLSTLA